MLLQRREVTLDPDDGHTEVGTVEAREALLVGDEHCRLAVFDEVCDLGCGRPAVEADRDATEPVSDCMLA